MRTKRRNINDLYAELNAPIRNKERNPLPPAPKSARSFASTNRPVKKTTNTSVFRKVENSTINVENVLLSSRKKKEEQVQQFIDDFNPKPMQVLQKIAQVSEMHKSILSMIMQELKAYPEEDFGDPLAEIGRDAITEIAVAKLKTIDLDKESQELDEEIDALKRELETAQKQNAKAKAEHERFTTLISKSTFDIFNAEERERQIQKQIELIHPKKDEEDTAKYNALWGESKHLNAEIQKLENLIKEERNFQIDHAKKRAEKKTEIKISDPSFEEITDVEKYAEDLLNPEPE